MNTRQQVWKVGEMRPSQVLFTFGVGSVADMPNFPVLIMGLDDWDETVCRPITEERLLSVIRQRMGMQVSQLLLPPTSTDDTSNGIPAVAAKGIPVSTFPRWFRCPRCDLLAPIESTLFELIPNLNSPDKTRYVHRNCNRGNNPQVVPVRFVAACKNGHLADFPWVRFVHRGGKCSNSSTIPPLRMREFGVSGDASDITVKCDACGMAPRRMADAFGKAGEVAIGPCLGHHPHLRRTDSNPCTEPQRTILLGASNSWFPITISALSIPSETDRLAQLVIENWAILEQAKSKDFITAFLVTHQLKGFEWFTPEQIWDATQKRQSAAAATGTGDEEIDLKTPEWEALTSVSSTGISDDFQARAVEVPTGYEKIISRVVVAERLREVRAMTGFTRVESPGDFYDSFSDPDQKIAPMTRSAPKWIPAIEVRGEGVFIQINEQVLQRWCERPSVQEREQLFFEAHKSWRNKRRMEPAEEGFPGSRFILLHSLAHALMRQFSLECGYSAASIRERIYSRDPDDPKGPMAGILFYTAATDSEGTLGGLVALGEPTELVRHLDQALENVRLCAADPLCSEHAPITDGLSLNGAACHACLHAPETSCEKGNKYLDRSVLVETFAELKVAFFDQGAE